jgi:hypothetical protein
LREFRGRTDVAWGSATLRADLTDCLPLIMPLVVSSGGEDRGCEGRTAALLIPRG